MQIAIDIIIILIILICTFIGYKRGLVKVVVGLLSFIIALILAVIIYKPVSNIIINNTNIYDNIKDGVYENIKDEDIENSESGIISFARNYIISEAKDATAEMISESIAEIVIDVLTFIIILIMTRIILIFVSVLFSSIANLPIIKQFNKAGGLIYGILQGIVINYILFALSLIVVQLSNVDSNFVNDTINKSKIGNVLYNENVIINLIK